MRAPTDRRYEPSTHLWLRQIDEHTVVVGLTERGQLEYGPFYGIKLPTPGDRARRGQPILTTMGIPGNRELAAPLSGVVRSVNAQLLDYPELVQQDSYGEGWLIEIQPADPSEQSELKSAEEYERAIA